MDMEVEKLNGGGINCGSTTAAAGGGGGGGGGKDEDDDVPLPGFRFHPTDEELVGFYLRRKVEKRPISIELIKQIDIYKHDPWDLPKASNVGEKEWYFFCKRGRKYRNSIRPNRVTGSGFWKATGIDRPIYSAGGEGRDCIGLKKSLVYYRGSAGKGTKTDWMMHEFRLPAHDHHHHHPHHHGIKTTATATAANHNITTQEAEVWTLCRIFKRNVSYRKCMPDWKELGAVKKNPVMNNIMDSNSKTCSSFESSDNHNNYKQSYISFSSPIITRQAHDQSNAHSHGHGQNDIITNQQQQMFMGQIMSSVSQHQQAPAASYSSSSFASSDVTEFLKHGDWDELRSVVEFGAAGRFLL